MASCLEKNCSTLSQHLDGIWNKFCYLDAFSTEEHKLRMVECCAFYSDILVLYINSQKLSLTNCIVIAIAAGEHFSWLLKLLK